MQTIIYVSTHGEKTANTVNPSLTKKGETQIQFIADSGLPEFSKVICGTGKRHLQTASLLNLTPDFYSPLCGSPDSSDVQDGKKVALLADGTTMPLDQWLIPTTKEFLFSLEDKTLIVGGRPFMLGLGYKAAKEGELIKITIINEGYPIIAMTEVISTSDGKLDIVS